ncbi:hypothetical protein EPN52_05280 [bacterium]|nr:MAG: hypothetical protein EPN52_05280 [bacterium]
MKRAGLRAAAAAISFALIAGCAPHLALSVNPNPVVLGRSDTHAVVRATAVGEGIGPLRIASMQVKLWGGARYLGHDVELYSRSATVDKTIFVLPLARATRSYDVPIDSLEVLIGNARYATVELRDPAGNTVGAARIDFTVDPAVARKF